jgi:exodeoxyribonuclease VII large subunit
MTELPDALSVSEIVLTIRQILTSDDRLNHCTVEGEIGDLTLASSGHVYFSLKDREASLRCVMWRSAAQRLSYRPQKGDHVRVNGSVDVYPPRGEMQFVVTRMQPVGVGDLHQQLERLKAVLDAEGLFALERKRPLPDHPMRIGVVTARESAAFQDVLKVLRGRFPLAHVILSSTLVQGELAPPQIVRAIGRLNAGDVCDVILICRGGGSLEDLWAFNDERVVRAVAASRVPTIAGVGHEVDTTLVDFAADVRAATPSNAAEMLTPDIFTLRQETMALRQALLHAMRRALDTRMQAVDLAAQALDRRAPDGLIREQRQRVDDWTRRLNLAHGAQLALRRAHLNAQIAALGGVDPDGPLRRGYARVRRVGGDSVSRVDQVQAGDRIRIEVSDGAFDARVE